MPVRATVSIQSKDALCLLAASLTTSRFVPKKNQMSHFFSILEENAHVFFHRSLMSLYITAQRPRMENTRMTVKSVIALLKMPRPKKYQKNECCAVTTDLFCFEIRLSSEGHQSGNVHQKGRRATSHHVPPSPNEMGLE